MRRPRGNETYSLCPRCKKAYNKRIYTDKFCGACGSLLIQQCPNETCKAEIESNIPTFTDQFCKRCGTNYYGESTQK